MSYSTKPEKVGFCYFETCLEIIQLEKVIQINILTDSALLIKWHVGLDASLWGLNRFVLQDKNIDIKRTVQTKSRVQFCALLASYVNSELKKQTFVTLQNWGCFGLLAGIHCATIKCLLIGE